MALAIERGKNATGGSGPTREKQGDFSKISNERALLLSLFGPATAGSVVNERKLRLANAATDACFANCASQSQFCKQACPVTFSTPCLSSCDSQHQTCRQGCQR